MIELHNYMDLNDLLNKLQAGTLTLEERTFLSEKLDTSLEQLKTEDPKQYLELTTKLAIAFEKLAGSKN